MKRFHFSLEVVLKTYQRTIKTIKFELSQLQNQMNDVLKNKIEIEEEISKVQIDYETQRTLGNARLYEQYLGALEGTKLNLENKLSELEKQVMICKEKLTQEVQKEKIIDKLKKKQYSCWRREKMKTEDNETSPSTFLFF